MDRGSFSVECIFTLFSFKLLYPDHFFMARGKTVWALGPSCLGLQFYPVSFVFTPSTKVSSKQQDSLVAFFLYFQSHLQQRNFSKCFLLLLLCVFLETEIKMQKAK